MACERTGGRCVLIVDDDDIVRMLLEDVCREHGWNAVSAATRDDAVLAAGLQEVHLILLDFNLAGTDALTLIPELRMVCPRTPIVVLTGQMPEEVRAGVEQAGAASILGKPCSVSQIRALLDRYRGISAGKMVPA